MKAMFAALCVVLVSGCSTITQSDTQSLALTSYYQDQPVAAACTLTNDKGSWVVNTPGNVMVRKSNEDLDVTCKRGGVPDGLLKAVSRAAGSMWGNILFGGGVGALIDHSRGNGYDYPTQLPVKMGESVVVDKKVSTEKTQAAGGANQLPPGTVATTSGKQLDAVTGSAAK